MGIVAYIGAGSSRSHVLEGLSLLDHRGYDVAGFGCLVDHNIVTYKAEGVDRLIQQLDQFSIDGSLGIGHMRWSTHGLAADLTNAHPHSDCTQSISLAHIGIIENHYDLRIMLKQAGHVFLSQTDTEVIVHLFESLLLAHGIARTALTELVTYLEGAYACAFIVQGMPDTLLLVRKRSPLCIGLGDNEMFIASDPLAFAGKTKKVLFMPDECFALVKKDGIELYNFASQPVPIETEEHFSQVSYVGKNNYEHFLLKEIYDQKKVIYDTVSFDRQQTMRVWDQMGLSGETVSMLNSITLIGCGTSWHAARVAQFFFEAIAHLPTKAYLASEFCYRPLFSRENSICIGISQSGQTADTLQALRIAQAAEIPTIGLTNDAASTIVREATGFLLTHASPEIAVASTKTFTAQLATLFLLAHHIALAKELITARQLEIAHEELLIVAEVLENALENYKRSIIVDAPFYATFNHFIFLGRHISYPFALEAALKLKEIAYLFVDCPPAGELKHGPLALVDNTTPVFIFSCLDSAVYRKLLANAQEVKARQGHIVAFAFKGQDELIALADKVFNTAPG